MKLEIKPVPSFTSSPFPLLKRQAEDVNYSGQTIIIPKGTSIPDYVRSVYGVTKLHPVTESFPFLSRDSEEKSYTPESVDKYVFNGRASIQMFKEEAKSLLKMTTDMWHDLGMPIAQDSERSVMVPDSSTLISDLLSKRLETPLVSRWKSERRALSAIMSNADILKKASLQRTVLPCWWVVSYTGQNAKPDRYLDEAVAILARACHIIRNTDTYNKVLHTVIQEQGDPLDTAIGYPLFSSKIDENGIPVDRLAMLSQYSGLATNQEPEWNALVSKVRERGRSSFEREFPFAIAPIRRIQPGWKWAHVFKKSSAGWLLDHDERGHSTNRVAWMAPYLLNLCLSPIQSEWKAIRKLIPGLFHDGLAKEATLDFLKSENPYLFESDFSNYDRSIPNNVMHKFFQAYCSVLPRSAYWIGALRQTQADLPLVWPDASPFSRSRGWAFNVKELALLSGIKITSEVGTFMNLIIQIAGWRANGVMSATEIISYLTGPASRGNTFGEDLQKGMHEPKVLIQSDDTLIINKDLSRGIDFVNAFTDGSKRAGVKAQLEVGDKFLMRHMTQGSDLPVSARVFQNTLNNEDPPDSALKFLVGLSVRTDGFFGWLTNDAFSQGRSSSITKQERDLELAVTKSILKFASTSSEPINEAVKLLESLVFMGENMQKDGQGRWSPKEAAGTVVSTKRNQFLKLLADHELKKIQEGLASGSINAEVVRTLLYQLHKNKQSPSSKLILDSLAASDEKFSQVEKRIDGLEHQFYKFAMKTIGVDLKVI